MKVLLLSAYDAASHQYWRKALVAQFPQYQFTVLTLPARFFSWRIRGNSLTWAYKHRDILEQGYDLIIATSMTDLSALKGLVPAIANTPSIIYFHENQFAYPKSGKEFTSVEPQVLNLYGALAADKVVFNSSYNQSSLIHGCQRLLKKLPDQVPDNIVGVLQEKSCVLPVPLSNSAYLMHKTQTGPLQIVWNHRWEFDKGPELLYRALVKLKQQSVDFKLHLVGQRFRYSPDVFEQIYREFTGYIGQWGFIESKAQYQELLQSSDVVLSTALHDFQGLAVLEGVAAGCIPVVPNRLAYPEYFPSEYCYQGGEQETDNLMAKLSVLAKQKQAGTLPESPNINGLSWQAQRGAYQRLIEDLVSD